MAVTKQKAPQKAAAKKTLKAKVTAKATKKIVKVTAGPKPKPRPKIKTKARVEVKGKAEVKAKKRIVKVAAGPKPKPRPKVETKAMVEVKAKGKKVVALPAKKKIVPQKKVSAQKPRKKALTVRKSVAPKKGSPAVTSATERFRGLKSMLITKRNALLNEAKQEIVKYVSGENRQLVNTAIDEADWAAVEISEDINLKRLSAQRQLLNDVEECLRKVNEGTYGICEDCGEEISGKRLRVIPTATLCIDCKEEREKMAILDQEADI